MPLLSSRRRRVIALLTLVAIAVSALSNIPLHRKKRFIEAAYSDSIAPLKAEMVKWDSSDRSWEWFQESDATVAALESEFDSPAVFSVSWSYDGHHGAAVVKPIPERGYSTFQIIPTTIWHPPRLYSGKSFDGTRLLIYKGWVHEAPEIRQFNVAFYADAIETQMQGR